jgi:chromosomal replication initiator protein
MFEEHVFAYRAAVKIQEMIAAGEIELVNIERRTVSQIVDEVLLGFPGIMVKALKGHSRTRPVVAARHAAIYAVWRERPDMSYPAIGRWFGKRDHSSAHHAVQKMKAQEAQKETSA